MEVNILLNILVTNRNKHEAKFEKAFAKYREKVIEQMKANLDAAKSGKELKVYINLVTPTSHSFDYNRAIGMVEATTEQTIELDAKDYGQLIMDKWDWTDQFNTTNSNYIDN